MTTPISRRITILAVLLFAIVLVSIVATFVIGNVLVTSREKGTKNVAGRFVPIVQVRTPVGWETATGSYRENPIQYGGPPQFMLLAPKQADVTSAPSVGLRSYTYNSQASLNDLMRVYIKQFFGDDNQLIPTPTTIMGLQALRVTVLGKQQAVGNQPYRIDQYLLRLPNEEILDIRITYPTEALWQQNTLIVEDILGSISLKQE